VELAFALKMQALSVFVGRGIVLFFWPRPNMFLIPALLLAFTLKMRALNF
jgi:putative Ca2+/H+ antiporter (TMEM165/GDT1 family)